MKRIVYYVWWATADENQNGTHYRSEPFNTEAKAQNVASLQWDDNDYVSIDKVHEEYTDYGWIQQDGTVTEVIEVVDNGSRRVVR